MVPLPGSRSYGNWKIAIGFGLLLLVVFLFYAQPENNVFRPPAAYYQFTQAPAVPITALKLRLLNPYKVEDETKSVCSPLNTAKKREPICVYTTAEDGYISKTINDKGLWEGDLVMHLITLMSRDPELGFIDIGVNVGIYTLTMASYGRKVVGVEPYQPNLRRLAKSLRLNPQYIPLVKIVPLATSDTVGEVMHFWARANHPGGTQLHAAKDSAKLGKGTTHHEVPEMSVDTIRLNDLLEVIDFDRAILKIDIEGGEYKALLGGSKLFDAVDITYVFMEWDNKCRFPEQRAFFVKFFRDRNYTVHRSTTKLEKLELSETGCKTWPFDVIFIKQK